MKAFVIVGIILLATFAVFVWFVRVTRQPKKLKIIHRQLELF